MSERVVPRVQEGLQRVLLVFQLFLLFSGIVLLCFDLWLLLDPSRSFFLRLVHFSVSAPHLQLAVYLLLGTSICVFVAVAVGFSGIMKLERCLISGFIALLVLLLHSKLVILLFIIFFRIKFPDESAMTSYLTQIAQKGYLHDKWATPLMDSIQFYQQCCGGSGARDYSDSYWYKTNNERGAPSFGVDPPLDPPSPIVRTKDRRPPLLFKLLQQLDEKQQLVAHMEKKLHAYEAERGENDRQKAELLTQLDEKQQLVAHMEKHLHAYEAERGENDRQKTQLLQHLDEKQQLVGHMEKKLHAYEAEKEQNDRQKTQLLQQLDEKQQLVAHMEKKLHAHEAERGENDRQKTQLLTQLDEKQKLVGHMEKQHLHAFEAERGENDRQKAELIRQLDEKHQFATQLERKLLAMESEIDSFDQVEESMLTANFKLQKELLKLKVRFGLISVDNAFKELGCCDKEVMEEIKTACQ